MTGGKRAIVVSPRCDESIDRATDEATPLVCEAESMQERFLPKGMRSYPFGSVGRFSMAPCVAAGPGGFGFGPIRYKRGRSARLHLTRVLLFVLQQFYATFSLMACVCKVDMSAAVTMGVPTKN